MIQYEHRNPNLTQFGYQLEIIYFPKQVLNIRRFRIQWEIIYDSYYNFKIQFTKHKNKEI